tara:strand:- start:121 stop:423 length:303 start_codon:yes stop_codon:yes gene_type:complete
MKKITIFVPIIFLIIATTLTKNSTKKLDKKIFDLKENIIILEDRYELILLDYNILTSPKKLMEYQELYFDDTYFQKNIENLNWIKIEDKIIKIDSLKNNE